MILNRDKCPQLKLKCGGRGERLRFQTSFTEELVIKRHTTIKHALSPDTIIHSKLTLCNWLHASLEPGASLGSESSALRPPTEHSGKIPRAPHLHLPCLITISGPTKGLPAGWPGSQPLRLTHRIMGATIRRMGRAVRRAMTIGPPSVLGAHLREALFTHD